MSTLSAALQSVPIAPELMGDQGIAQDQEFHVEDGQANGQGQPNATSSSYPGYANSSLRGEAAEDGWVYEGDRNGNGTGQIWDEGYSTQYPDNTLEPPQPAQHANPSQRATPSPLPDEQSDRKRKRSRNPTAKTRLPKSRLDKPDDPIEGEMEYEHPSRDIRLGAVFVHPIAGSAQACVRCHRIKRKCEGGKPRCAGCTKADVACVFELSPATSG
jgi:hypothetical protein